MQRFDRLDLQLFARRGGRNYMMRSEKRPSYNRPEPARRPKRRRANYGYIILTLVVSILLWPVGLFLIWNRRLRCGVGGKLLWSVATLAVFCGLIAAVLTVPTGNADFQRFQDKANDFFETAGAGRDHRLGRRSPSARATPLATCAPWPAPWATTPSTRLPTASRAA